MLIERSEQLTRDALTQQLLSAERLGNFTLDLQSRRLSWQELIRLFIPRITILAFIEILAGFFLRQYRVGVEDLKYFLELERKSNARRVAYAIYRRSTISEYELKFATDLLNDNSTLRLAPGESNTVLEGMKLEKNIALEVLATITEQIKAASGFVKAGKESKSA